jgi:hypothetical protein
LSIGITRQIGVTKSRPWQSSSSVFARHKAQRLDCIINQSEFGCDEIFP